MNELEKRVWTEAFIFGMKDYAKRGSPSDGKNLVAIAANYADEALKEYRAQIERQTIE